MAIKQGFSPGLAAAAVATLGLAGFLQTQIDPLRRQPAIEPPNVGKAAVGFTGATLPFEYTLGAVSGFRQIIAGLLWVRADSFFHGGNYDAILPLIRLITWLDPNWLDPYSTGAWHLTYNFTDTDQRSDRRYLPAGVALLNEGIKNNSEIFDMYKEKGWLYYDKIKDYKSSAEAYEGGLAHNPDITQVGHALAHAYERAGDLDNAEKTWKYCIAEHQKILDDPKVTSDQKIRATQGLSNATTNLTHLLVRREARQHDTKVPLDVNFRYRITRVKPKVFEVAGTWNLVGARSFDYNGKKIAVEGPVEGARVEVRLQDAGYKMPSAESIQEFTFDVDTKLTIMQDILSTRGGKVVRKGELYLASKTIIPALEKPAENAGIYGFKPAESKDLGIPIDKALASNMPLTPFGQQQLANIAYPLPYGTIQPIRTMQETPALIAKLKSDPATIKKLAEKGYCVATQDRDLPGEYRREIDMSKDPTMYSFTAEKYDLILTINPAHTPDFVRDRIGWKGEGWTDKRFLDTTTVPGSNLIRVVIPITREQLLGTDRKLITESDVNLRIPSEIYKGT